MKTIELENKKYTIIYNEHPHVFQCLRYGQPWQDLSGNNLVSALVDKLEDLANRVKYLETLLDERDTKKPTANG